MFGLPALSFLLLIPFAWCGLSWLLSRISGWHRLASRYRSTQTIDGETAALRTARIGPVNYHSCVRFRINTEGLGISVASPFRLGHPPLFIPWNEFHHVAEDGMMYSQKAKASIGTPTVVRVTLPGWVRYRMPASLRPENPSLSKDDD